MTATNSTVAVVGCGYLGAVFATVLVEQGNRVIGLDVDQAKISQLAAGVAPFYEPEFETVLQQSLNTGNLIFTTDETAISDAEIVFICVGTPQADASAAADLSQIWSAIDAIAPHLAETAIVVGRSTVPVGTAAEIQNRLSRLTNRTYEVAWNPEFLREGLAISDTRKPDRIVIGTTNEIIINKLNQIYKPQLDNGVPVLVMDVPTAELVKVSANAFLATKISFINAISQVAAKSGADITALAKALGLDPRIGNKFLGAGIGFGGGCLPKDLRAFIETTSELGLTEVARLLSTVDQINLQQREQVVQLAKQALGDLVGKKIVVLGAAFKPDSDDVRDSPALDVALALQQLGGVVLVHDPKALPNAKARFPELNCEADLTKIFNNSDLVLHLTEWQQYRDLDPTDLRAIVNNPAIIDGRNVLDFAKWRAAGWQISGMGKNE